jgi:hypothetical protein
MKKYPLQIEVLHDDDCATVISRGHHDSKEFMVAVMDYGYGYIPEHPRHGFGKTVPCRSGEYTYKVQISDTKTRGAYPVTYVSEL